MGFFWIVSPIAPLGCCGLGLWLLRCCGVGRCGGSCGGVSVSVLVGVVRLILSGKVYDLRFGWFSDLDLGSMLDPHSGTKIRNLFANGCGLFSLLTIGALAHVGFRFWPSGC